MKKIGISLLIILTCSGCQNKYRDLVLENKIKELALQAPINLNRITDFDWDTIRIAGPYAVSGQLEIEAIPRSLQNELDVLNMSDGECLIIFTHNRKVIKYAKINRSIYDFSRHKNVYTRGDIIE
ncbi:MAG: hypothetical protein ACRDD8_13510 [Bacteroidales bacterium]